METVIKDYFNNLCCAVTPVLNLKIRSATFFEAGVYDQVSFETESGTTVNNFTLTDTYLECQVLTITGGTINLSGMNITELIEVDAPGLITLELTDNSLTEINPTTPLPTTLQELRLKYNQIDNTGYTNSEPWASNMHNGTGPTYTINFIGNPATVYGTGLETILTAKGWTII
jgi:hypothetical protein